MRPLSLDSVALTSPTLGRRLLRKSAPCKPLSDAIALSKRCCKQLQTDNNRLGAGRVDPAVERSLQEHITYLEAEVKTVADEIRKLIDQHSPLRRQRDLVTSIPGIADLTASRILGEIPNISEYRSAKALGPLPASRLANISQERSAGERASLK